MLSLLVTHTVNRNSHKYLIDLLIIHMIQYSSGYDLRFPRKRSWFESQFGNNIFFLLLFLLFIVCVCCFYFDIFSFFIFNRIDNPSTSAFRYKITEGSRYFVLCIEIQYFLVFRLIMLAKQQFLTPRMKFVCSKTCLQGIYHISHNLLFELPKIATFIAHKNKLLK